MPKAVGRNQVDYRLELLEWRLARMEGEITALMLMVERVFYRQLKQTKEAENPIIPGLDPGLFRG
jgi:hypothetical protein